MRTSIEAFSSRGAVLLTEPAHILLADDDPEMRSLVSWVLQLDGHQIEEVADGRELVERLALLLNGGSPDHACQLLIADVRMPGYGGLDVLSALRCLGNPIPTILMTGFADRYTRRMADVLGAAAVFDKPFEMDDLRTAVLNILSRRTRLPSQPVLV